MADSRSRGAASALPRKRPVQQRATLTIDAIIIAVERILDREGFKGLTTNRVGVISIVLNAGTPLALPEALIETISPPAHQVPVPLPR